MPYFPPSATTALRISAAGTVSLTTICTSDSLRTGGSALRRVRLLLRLLVLRVGDLLPLLRGEHRGRRVGRVGRLRLRLGVVDVLSHGRHPDHRPGPVQHRGPTRPVGVVGVDAHPPLGRALLPADLRVPGDVPLGERVVPVPRVPQHPDPRPDRGRGVGHRERGEALGRHLHHRDVRPLVDGQHVGQRVHVPVLAHGPEQFPLLDPVEDVPVGDEDTVRGEHPGGRRPALDELPVGLLVRHHGPDHEHPGGGPLVHLLRVELLLARFGRLQGRRPVGRGELLDLVGPQAFVLLRQPGELGGERRHHLVVVHVPRGRSRLGRGDRRLNRRLAAGGDGGGRQEQRGEERSQGGHRWSRASVSRGRRLSCARPGTFRVTYARAGGNAGPGRTYPRPRPSGRMPGRQGGAMSDATRYVVRRLNWQEPIDKHFIRLPGGTDVAAFPTLEEAETERRGCEARVRAAVNPFACASFYELSWPPRPVLYDWMSDVGLEPPPGDLPPSAWRVWWDVLNAEMSEDQLTHAWNGLDKLRFYETVERTDTGVVHVVLDVNWEADRGYAYWFIAPFAGGHPTGIYLNRDAAEAAAREVRATRQGTYDEDESYRRYGSRAEVTRDPFFEPLAVDQEGGSLQDTIFAEVATVPFQPGGRPFGRRVTLFLVQRFSWAWAGVSGLVALRSAEIEPDRCDGIPAAAFVAAPRGWNEDWRGNSISSPRCTRIRSGSATWPCYHPSANSGSKACYGMSDSIHSTMTGTLAQLGRFTARDADERTPGVPAEHQWAEWWSAHVDEMSPEQRDTVWDLLDQLRLHTVIELLLES